MIDTTEQAPTAPGEKPKQKKKRYQSREQVEAAIDEVNRDIKLTNLEAEVQDAFADTLRDKFQNVQLPYGYEISKFRDKAEKLRDRANRYKNVKLAKLKRVLQTIATPTLSIEISGGDNSVPMP